MYEAIRRQAADRSAGRDGESCVFFVGRENYPLHWVEGASYEWGKAQVTRPGSDVVLVGCGTLFGKAVEAAAILAGRGIRAAVVNNPFVNRADIETLGPLVHSCGGRVVTIEDHQLIGGMGAMLAHALSRAGIPHRMTSLGINGEFGQSAYLAEHLYERHGLTGPKMAEAATALLA